MKVIINFEDDHEENMEEVNDKWNQFEKIFNSDINSDIILDSIADAGAAIMYITSATGMSLDEAFDMYTERLKKELDAEDIKSLLELDKLINDFFGI